jgi:hypothetical protein
LNNDMRGTSPRDHVKLKSVAAGHDGVRRHRSFARRARLLVAFGAACSPGDSARPWRQLLCVHDQWGFLFCSQQRDPLLRGRKCDGYIGGEGQREARCVGGCRAIPIGNAPAAGPLPEDLLQKPVATALRLESSIAEFPLQADLFRARSLVVLWTVPTHRLPDRKVIAELHADTVGRLTDWFGLQAIDPASGHRPWPACKLRMIWGLGSISVAGHLRERGCVARADRADRRDLRSGDDDPTNSAFAPIRCAGALRVGQPAQGSRGRRRRISGGASEGRRHSGALSACQGRRRNGGLSARREAWRSRDLHGSQGQRRGRISRIAQVRASVEDGRYYIERTQLRLNVGCRRCGGPGRVLSRIAASSISLAAVPVERGGASRGPGWAPSNRAQPSMGTVDTEFGEAPGAASAFVEARENAFGSRSI